MVSMASVIPELDVLDLGRSRHFYESLLGFAVLFERPEEGFVFLELDGAQLMLEQAYGPGRRFRDAPLEPPLGRGLNLQIRVDNVDGLIARVRAAGLTMLIEPEERWYRKDTLELGNRQFVVADPDGYLLRFFSDLGSRPVQKNDLDHEP